MPYHRRRIKKIIKFSETFNAAAKKIKSDAILIHRQDLTELESFEAEYVYNVMQSGLACICKRIDAPVVTYVRKNAIVEGIGRDKDWMNKFTKIGEERFVIVKSVEDILEAK